MGQSVERPSFMEIVRWTIAGLVAIPTFVIVLCNFGIGCRNLIYFTDRSPSPIPVLGTVGAIVGLLAIPRSGSTFSQTALIVFAVLLVLDVFVYLASGANRLRAIVTGRNPT